ncbi:MAG: sulfatase-like hydrolase/transferase [Thermoanaerobaculia bacterium]
MRRALGRSPDVLLITVDTLRPDALGWTGGGNRTPVIDALAQSAFRFPAAVSPAPLTLPAHSSILTALQPRRHGVRDNGQMLPAGGAELLGERLRSAGWETAAFVSGFPLAAPFGLDRGFDQYDDRFAEGPRDRLERRAEETVAAALAWIGSRSGPWFVWVHLYDPHDPYEARGTPVPGDPRSAYLAEVRAVDAALAPLVATEPRAGRNRLTIFAGDHGESLGEHGEATHGFFVYQSTLAVPLFFRFPGVVKPAESAERVRLVDLAPTVLELLGLPAWSGRDGVSLAGLFRGEKFSAPPALAESRRPWQSYGWAPLAAAIDGRWKLIAAPRPELYDLEADPGETRNLYATAERKIARRLAAVLAEQPSAAPVAAGRDDPETVAKLRALGYLGAGSPSATDAASPPGLPDPKDRIGVWNRLGEAEQALERGDVATALARFDRALAEDAANPFALARSAEALAALGRPADAIGRLERAVRGAPDQPEIRRALAELLLRTGRTADAVVQWMELVRLQPRVAAGWSGLGAALGRSGERQRALEAMARAAELAPDDAELHTKLAFAAFGAGDRERAARELERSARLALRHLRARRRARRRPRRSRAGAAARSWLERATPARARVRGGAVPPGAPPGRGGRGRRGARLAAAGARFRRAGSPRAGARGAAPQALVDRP